MRKLINILIMLPLAVVLIVLCVANRQNVRFSLDPFNTTEPAISVTVPFFVFLFGALLAGIIIGWIANWMSQRKYRLELRTKRSEVERYRRQNENQMRTEKATREFAPGLPLMTNSDKAA